MDEAPSAEEDVVSFPIPVENRTSASTRGPESSDDLPGAIDGDNTLEDDLILRCETCDEHSWLVRRKAYVTEDEVQRLFAELDTENKGYISHADVLALRPDLDPSDFFSYFETQSAESVLLARSHTAANMVCSDAMGVEEPDKPDSDIIRFSDFTNGLRKMCEEHGTIGLLENVALTLSESSASLFASLIATTVMLVIIVSTMAFIVETIPESREAPKGCPSCEPRPVPAYAVIEKVCIAIFTVEYLGRVLSVPFSSFLDNSTQLGIDIFKRKHVYLGDSRGNRLWNYVTEVMNLIDLLAIVPFYIEIAVGNGSQLQFLRVMRLTRVFRIFKMSKYSSGATLLGRTLVRSLAAMQLLFFFSLIGLTVFATVIYFCETGKWTVTEDYPNGMYLVDVDYWDPTGTLKVPSDFTSIPRCFWFVLVTTTTVGYGDMVPVTAMGKTIGGVLMISGLLVLALPITVLGSNFAAEVARFEEEQEKEKLAKELRAMHNQALRALDAEVSDKSGKTGKEKLGNVGGKALSVVEGFVSAAGKVSKIRMRVKNRRRRKEEETSTRTTDNLLWVAVVRLADDIKSNIRKRREELRISPLLGDTLMQEVTNMMEVGSNTQATFADIMPSLNTAVTWITREYKDPKKVLHPRQGMQLIQLFFKLASDICMDRLVQSHTQLPGTPQGSAAMRPMSVEDLPEGDPALPNSRRTSMVGQVR